MPPKQTDIHTDRQLFQKWWFMYEKNERRFPGYLIYQILQ